MPRFNQKRWSPAKDSSPGCATLDRHRVVLLIPPAEEVGEVDDGKSGFTRPACPCGCGEYPKGKTAVFAMGHDAKLRGKLIRAHLTGTEILHVSDVSGRGVTGGEPTPVSAMFVAEGHGWEEYLLEAERRRDDRNREVLQRTIGSKRLISVGRWEYTGQVMAVYSTEKGDELEVEYVTKSGEIKKRKVPADEALELEKGQD